jgi:hypothetical protein
MTFISQMTAVARERERETDSFLGAKCDAGGTESNGLAILIYINSYDY